MDEVVAGAAQKLQVSDQNKRPQDSLMVGDGVNDAPAPGGADVRVIGTELNEVALGGADVALLGTDLGRLPQIIGLADITDRSLQCVARVQVIRRVDCAGGTRRAGSVDRCTRTERGGVCRCRKQRADPAIWNAGDSPGDPTRCDACGDRSTS